MALSTANNLFPQIDQNQFKLTAVRGLPVFASASNFYNVKIDPSDPSTYFVGDAVALSDSSTLDDGIIVTKSSTKKNTLGIIIYQSFSDRFYNDPNNNLSRPVFEIMPTNGGGVIWLEVSSPIGRGALLSVDTPDTYGIIRYKMASTGDYVVAIAMQASEDAGTVIKCELVGPGYIAP